MYRLVDMPLAVLVTPRVAKPYIVAKVSQEEGQITLLLKMTDPDFGTHHEAVIQKNNRLAGVLCGAEERRQRW